MQKLQCPECLKSFMWTDDMPLSGNCPTEGCEWRYNIHAELKKTMAKIAMPDNNVLCPHCGKPITSTMKGMNKIAICQNCGDVILGSHVFTKKRFFMVVVLAIVVISALYKIWTMLK